MHLCACRNEHTRQRDGEVRCEVSALLLLFLSLTLHAPGVEKRSLSWLSWHSREENEQRDPIRDWEEVAHRNVRVLVTEQDGAIFCVEAARDRTQLRADLTDHLLVVREDSGRAGGVIHLHGVIILLPDVRDSLLLRIGNHDLDATLEAAHKVGEGICRERAKERERARERERERARASESERERESNRYVYQSESWRSSV